MNITMRWWLLLALLVYVCSVIVFPTDHESGSWTGLFIGAALWCVIIALRQIGRSRDQA